MAKSYGVKTKLKADEIFSRTISYFGPGGLGLSVTEESPCCIRLEGGGGFVEVHVSSVSDGEPTEVDLVLHEYEQHAIPFMRKIKK
jgi:hypothetical protein